MRPRANLPTDIFLVIVTEAQKSFASLIAMTQHLVNLSESAEYWGFHDPYSRSTLFPEYLLKTKEVMQEKVLAVSMIKAGWLC